MYKQIYSKNVIGSKAGTISLAQAILGPSEETREFAVILRFETTFRILYSIDPKRSHP
jgi:hypothetical protein